MPILASYHHRVLVVDLDAAWKPCRTFAWQRYRHGSDRMNRRLDFESIVGDLQGHLGNVRSVFHRVACALDAVSQRIECLRVWDLRRGRLQGPSSKHRKESKQEGPRGHLGLTPGFRPYIRWLVRSAVQPLVPRSGDPT